MYRRFRQKNCAFFSFAGNFEVFHFVAFNDGTIIGFDHCTKELHEKARDDLVLQKEMKKL